MINDLITIAFSGFWKFIGVFIIFYTIVEIIYRLLSGSIRMTMVLFRGWPPEHLDADGDWKPEKKENEG